MGKEIILFGDIEIDASYIMLPKTSAYVKIYDGETKWMHFSTENDELLEKYNIQEKVSTSFKK